MSEYLCWLKELEESVTRLSVQGRQHVIQKLLLYVWRLINDLHGFVNVCTSGRTCEWAKTLEKISVRIRSGWLTGLSCRSTALKTELQHLWGQTMVGQGSFDSAKALVQVLCPGNGSWHLKMTCRRLSSATASLNKRQSGKEGVSNFKSCTGCLT